MIKFILHENKIIKADVDQMDSGKWRYFHVTLRFSYYLPKNVFDTLEEARDEQKKRISKLIEANQKKIEELQERLLSDPQVVEFH